MRPAVVVRGPIVRLYCSRVTFIANGWISFVGVGAGAR
jgi:hypothetical protein